MSNPVADRASVSGTQQSAASDNFGQRRTSGDIPTSFRRMSCPTEGSSRPATQALIAFSALPRPKAATDLRSPAKTVRCESGTFQKLQYDRGQPWFWGPPAAWFKISRRNPELAEQSAQALTDGIGSTTIGNADRRLISRPTFVRPMHGFERTGGVMFHASCCTRREGVR